MYFLITPRRRLGVAVDKKELAKIPPIRGDVQIIEAHENLLGRTTTTAWIFSSAPGENILPRLLDVRITGMATGGMNLTGVEMIDDALYAQSWWCRFA
ncbi:hypothetical protein BWR59_16905 [Pseudomonas sp. Bc-h]|uniref:hypothetical protein n=1 Tax=Pseudomonas sp. Bc-h TaxID=1943632 RepID=UPI0009DA9E63|nr:hypothetical protein [Pseudomonas sp. Bc-h]OQR30240.1 hypothetical protein BWR59_16905 [Pseudomonas sp. Bc-h]